MSKLNDSDGNADHTWHTGQRRMDIGHGQGT